LLYRNSLGYEDKELPRKPRPLITLTFLLALILTIRLFYIQVLQYNLYYSKSESISIKRQVIEASRGFITDRNREILAENLMSYSITVDPFERDKIDVSIPRLASLVPDLPEILNVPSDKLIENVKNKISGQKNPYRIIRDADFPLLSIVEEHNRELPGIGGGFFQRRNYPHGPLAAHVIGYMTELTEEEYKRKRDEGYMLGHSIGRYGIEKYYENRLRGKNGAKFMEMNYRSRILNETGEINPIPPMQGEDIMLTLDMRIQMAAEEAFGDSILGALVALNPQNGEVLVMVSSPSFDPNEFTHALSPLKYASLMNNPDEPMFNRAIQGTYAPGSTFKMLTALAGLENGYTENSRFKPCTGTYFFGRSYDCWKVGGHGSLNMVESGDNTPACSLHWNYCFRRDCRKTPYGENRVYATEQDYRDFR